MIPLMVEQWQEIKEFPGYSVSNCGHVRNDSTGRLLNLHVSQRVVYVALTRDLVHYSRSVTRLVADTFLPPPELPVHRKTFDTPICLDGDRTNNHITNLMWRPRWFAAKFHQQFSQEWDSDTRIQEVTSRRWFEGPLFAASAYGLLAVEVLASALDFGYYGKPEATVWPTGQSFRFSKRTHIIPRQIRRV